MPLFMVQSRRKENIPDAEYQSVRQEHLRWQFETEASGRLFAAGGLVDPAEGPPPRGGMYIVVCEDEREARAHAESDPYHARGIRDYHLYHWTLNESSFLGVGFRAAVNGDDPSNPKYRPPADGAN